MVTCAGGSGVGSIFLMTGVGAGFGVAPCDGFGVTAGSGAGGCGGSGVTTGRGVELRSGCGVGLVDFLRCGVGEWRVAGFGFGLGFGVADLSVSLSGFAPVRDFRNISFFSSSVRARSARGASAMLKAAAKMKNLRTVGWRQDSQQASKIQYPFCGVEPTSPGL